MLIFQRALEHARVNFGIEYPNHNWEPWSIWTREYPKGDLQFPGKYWAALMIGEDNSLLDQIERELIGNGYTIVWRREAWRSGGRGAYGGFLFHSMDENETPNHTTNYDIHLVVG